MSHNEHAQSLLVQASLRAAPAPPSSLRILELKMDTEHPSDILLIERLQLWDDALSKLSWNSLREVILHKPHHETLHYEGMLRRCSSRLNEKGKLFVQ